MKKTSYIVILVFGLFNCNNETIEKSAEKTPVNTLTTVLPAKQNSDSGAGDKPQYDQIFMDGLAGYHEPLKIIGNYITNGKDTTYFPDDLPINKKTVFKGVDNGNTFILTVTRTNLTNLTYHFQLTNKDNKPVESRSGTAVLGSLFFLASESYNDTESGTAYGSHQYWDKANDCWFSILIGIGPDDNGKQRATLLYGCEDKNKEKSNIKNCPTLRTD